MDFKKIILINLIAFYISSFICLYSKEMIILNSIPRCGTHLAIKCINLLTGKQSVPVRWNPEAKPNQFYFTGDDIEQLKKIFSETPENKFISSHLTFSSLLEDEIIKKGYKVIFIYRDPRAQLVSMARWKKEWKADMGMSLDDSISSLITNSKLYKIGWANVGNVVDLYKAFMPWALNAKFLAIRFEALVGPKGGGGAKEQAQTIKKIANFLGVNVSKNNVVSIGTNLFGGTATFDEGKIDGWKKYFKDKHKEAFKKNAGQLLIDLGYEKDLSW